jgi:hypothetical protein
MLQAKKSRPNPAKEQAIKELIAQPKKRLNVEIDEAIYTRLKVAVAADKTSISALVSNWVNEYLSNK